MKLLVLAPVFPPRGGPGAIRYAHLCHWWAKAGHTVDVVTSRAGWHRDERLLELVDVAGLNIYRVEGPNVGAWLGAGVGASLGAGLGSRIGAGLGARIGGGLGSGLGAKVVPDVLQRLFSLEGLREGLKDPTADPSALRTVANGLKSVRDQVAVPDEHLVSIPGWVGQIESLLKENHYDALLTTSYPYSSHVAGALVKMRHAELRWVMELRDPWAGTVFRGRERGIGSQIDGTLEAFCVERADVVSVISPQMQNDMLERYDGLEPGENLVVTANGFSEVGPLANPPESPPWIFAYTGTFDQHWEPVPPLLELFLYLDNEHGLGERMKLRWAGSADMPSAEALRKFRQEMPGVLDALGQIPYDQVRSVKEDAHALVLTLAPGAPVFTTKLFEYVDSGRPIVALVAPGDACAVLQKAGNALCIDPGRIGAGARALADAMNQGLETGTLNFGNRDVETIAPHRYDNLAQAFAKTLAA
ncbi:MAG: glycosyltransferase [Myxococcota bacterium]